MPSNKDRLLICLYHRSGAPKMPGGEDEYAEILQLVQIVRRSHDNVLTICSSRFHWALGVLPKIWHPEGSGILHHAKDNPPIPGMTKWTHEARALKSIATPNLLARIVVAKVLDLARVETILNGVPLSQEDPTWNCVVWVREALVVLDADRKALGTRQLSWDIVREKALDYVKRKRDAGRYKTESEHDRRKPPTYDILDGSEVLT